MEQFIPGQRWISHAEIQLGLGIIIETDHRTVTIRFEAGDETRTYSQQNAPLTRVIYDQGESVKTSDGDSIEIINVSETDGIVNYSGINSCAQTVTINESQLDHFIQLNRPIERLFNGQIDKNRWFELRYKTLQHLSQLSHSELSGLTSCRTSLIPHQLFIAHEVANRYAPRVLLADEVGLGKTIEAGLIIHHQLLNERANRVLIIVPESLTHQWLVEMVRRFNLMFSIFDEPRCQAMSDEDNLFLSEQKVLCSLEFLAQNNSYYQQALEGEWDLLVVDEAHHLQWTPENSSDEYQVIEQLAKRIKGILLLTATPEQLGIESHFARLRLLDPDRFSDLEPFIAEEQGYRPIAHAMEALLSNQPFDESVRQTLKEVLKEEHSLDKWHTDKQSIIKHMLDRHGTGRVLFRNTRTAVTGFPGRKVFAHPQKTPEQYLQCLKHFTQHFLRTNLKSELRSGLIQELEFEDNSQNAFSNLVLFPELLYQIVARHFDFVQDWQQIDPRVRWLGEWLSEIRQVKSNPAENKTLVITANAHTAKTLADSLKHQWGLYAAVFHEDLNLLERDRAAAFFADPDHGAPVLICSEIGSEGRNFQFAHQMVLFDLPINPDLLEQRIGRLDRIGQSQTIEIHIPYLENTAQAILYQWYHEGLNAFEQTCPGGHTIFEQQQTRLQEQMLKEQLMHPFSLSKETPQLCCQSFSEFILQTQKLHQQLNHALQAGRDKLLEYNSCRQPEADRLKTLAEQSDKDATLSDYMDDLFDAFGVEHSEHSDQCFIISPGEHMINQFPGLADDGMTITYDRAIALANEDMQFFTWDHPMVKSAMEMIHSSEMGNTTMTTLASSELNVRLSPGTLLLECLFVVETTAHEILQANRYLPPTTIRIVIDERGNEYTDNIAHNMIDTLTTETINTQTAQQIVKVKQETLQQLLARAENLCNAQTPEIIQSARKSSQQTLVNEIDRLRVLAQVNPNIREEEIDFFTQQLQSLDTIFDSVRPRLDALRIIVIT